MPTEAMTLEDVRAAAKEKLKGICMVYRECDGHPSRFCQGHQYGRPLGIGGVGSGVSFHNNWLALRGIGLKMQLTGPHFEPDTACTFLGRSLTMPIMPAPVAGVNSFGGETVISEREFCRAVVLGANAAGTMGWRGDSYTYSVEDSFGLDAIKEGGQGGVKIVKPREQREILAFFEKAGHCNATAVGVDIDGCGSYAMRKYKKGVFRKTPAELRELVEATPLPVIFKGVMCPEDALVAAEAGAAAIVVSNHGGRVHDYTPGTADVLPGIVAALAGRKVAIVADGGIRTGYDAFKMLALGADVVLVGRDIVRAAVGAGIEGVRLQMEHLRTTLVKCMLMTGCATLAAIGPELLVRGAQPEDTTGEGA